MRSLLAGRDRFALRAAARLLAGVVAATAFAGATLGVPAARAATPSGGVVLDLFGGLHTFGGATVDTVGAPYWHGWDIARSVSVLPDASGGWTLDGYGGIHAWGGAGAVAAPTYLGGDPLSRAPVYWHGWDIARALVVLPDQQSGYVLDGYGGLHEFGPNAPRFDAPAYWHGWDIARGLEVVEDASGVATGGWVLDGWGGLHSFGTVPGLSAAGPYYPWRDVWQKFHVASDGTPYMVSRWGAVSGAVSPDWSGYIDWGNWNATRDLVLFAPQGGAGAQPVTAPAAAELAAAEAMSGGVRMDGYGGLQTFGHALVNGNGSPYWPGWDIARALAVLPDGTGGWTLDGYGGIHNWGNAPPIAASTYSTDPNARSPAYFHWDIARDMVILPDHQSGYLLDGYGGLHEFGPHAPAFGINPIWNGWDIARGVSVTTDSTGTATGGWIMDGWGGLHPFGNPGAISVPTTYHPDHDVWQKLRNTIDGSWYGVARWGLVWTSPGLAPNWDGYSDFGNAPLIRDVAILNPLMGGGDQPASADARAAFNGALQDTGVLAKPGCNTGGLATPAGKYLVISTECQELTAYQDGNVIADMLVTTGRPVLPTREGHTRVLSKNHPWLMQSTWAPGTIGWYPPTWVSYVTWIWNDGTGIHDASWEPDSALGPGSQDGPFASHGCIHVTVSWAQWIYGWADIGIPVDVV